MKLFMSYAHDDNTIVQQLKEVLFKGGHTVWIDSHIVTGREWQKELENEIRTASGIVLAITPKWLNSPWCQWEFVTAYELGKKVIPVMLEETKLPDRIGKFQYADFTGGFTDTAKIQKFLNDLLDLATKVSANEVAGIDKEAQAAAINQNNQNQNSGQQISGGSNINATGGNVATGGSNIATGGSRIDNRVRTNSPNIRIGGNVSGGMVNIGGTQTVHGNINIKHIPSAADNTQQELQALVKQLNEALAALPPEQRQQAQAVEQLTQSALDEAAKPQPNKTILQVTGEGLKKAAENLLTVAPIVGQIAFKLLGIG
jgi:hypothetical protein